MRVKHRDFLFFRDARQIDAIAFKTGFQTPSRVVFIPTAHTVTTVIAAREPQDG